MSKTKTDVWMPVYIGDYLADTMRLSTVQHGAYFLLMMEYWKQGPLPNDHDELSAIARADRKVWDKSIWPTLKRFFSLEDDGLFHQKRADRERAFAAEKSEKRSAAARAKWDANAKQKPCKKDANAYANASDMDVQTGVQNGVQNACKQHDTCASRAGASPSPSQYTDSSLRSESGGAVAPPDLPTVRIVPAPEPRSPRGTRLPSDWEPDADLTSFAEGLGLNPGNVAAKFRDHWISATGQRATKLDWKAAFRLWCRNDAERGGGRQSPQSKRSQFNETWKDVPDLEAFTR